MEHKEKQKITLSGKIICRIFWDEYVHWICSPKWVTILIFLVLIREIVVLPMLNAADQMGQIVNLLEPAIAVGNSGLILLLLPLFYILLISDSPKISANLYYLLPRAGRRNWVAGELLFQLASALTYLTVVVVYSCIQVYAKAYCINGWSLVVTQYRSQSGGLVGLFPMQLYNQMPPFQAFFLTYGLLLLYLLLWGTVALLAALYAKKKVAFWSETAVMAVGLALTELKSRWMWLLPSAHGIVWPHYQKYYRKYVFPIAGSVLLFLAGLILVVALIWYRAKRVSMDILWEEKIE